MCAWSTMSRTAKQRLKNTSSKVKTWKPLNLQLKAINFCIERGGAGVFADPGTGKTTVMASVFQILRDAGLVERMLVIAPLQPCFNVWSKSHDDSDFVKWKEFEDLRISLIHGKKKDQAFEEDADIYVMNPEGLEYFVETKVHVHKNGSRREFKLKPGFKKNWKFDMLVVDECTDFKHSNTLRSKRLNVLLNLFSRRYILTGSPAANGLMDLFGQIYIVDGGRSLGQYITHYRRRFFEPDGQYNWRIQKGAEEKIYEAISDAVIRIDAEDELELPPKILRNIKFDLPTKARKTYEEMEEDFILELEQGSVTAVNAASASSKLRQIANGGVYLDPTGPEEKRRAEDIHQAKIEATLDLLSELNGKPTLVAYEFNHDLARLKKALGKDTPHLGSGVSQKQSQQIQRDWNAGRIPYLLCQPQSMSRGLNLQGSGRAVIWHSITWNYEHYDQFIRRIWRTGQKERVFIYHLIARKTIDEAIMKTLGKKARVQNALLKALKEYYL